MKRYLLAWVIATFFASPSAKTQSGGVTRSEALVRSFYAQVVARHPHDIPKGSDWEIFAPYLSKGLLHRIDLAKACSADRDRQRPDSQLMTRIVSEYGLFSGDEAAPQTFQIEKTDHDKDDSWRVYVNLTVKTLSRGSWTWPVAAIVVQEDDHSVIDDVLYIDDAIYDRQADRRHERLSEYLSAGCIGARWSGPALPNQPEALVRSLYSEVVARRPVGIPRGIDWKVFAPYLSKELLRRIHFALECGEDWERQHPDPNLKPEIGWLELGLFSGGDDELELRTFHIEKTQPVENGSFRVYVGLIWGYPPERPWTSRVSAKIVRENAHLLIDDVTYLKDDTRDTEWQLSDGLSSGCDGSRWVGFHDSK